ncbi:hypothetical protein Tco_1292158 [Tanacetum coccineum]
MKKAFQDMLHRLGEVNPTHENYNDSCTSKDTEDPSWSTSFKNRRTQKTSSTLEDFISVVIVLVRNIVSKGRLKRNRMQLTKLTAEHLPRRGGSLAQKAKTTEEDTGSPYQIRKNLARMKKTYPSLGCVKK